MTPYCRSAVPPAPPITPGLQKGTVPGVELWSSTTSEVAGLELVAGRGAEAETHLKNQDATLGL